MLNIYKASAGSGKTYRLAYTYIRLLLQGASQHALPHRNILAVTFTNKATDEMKRRILHELAILAGVEQGRTSDYLDDLLRDIPGATPDTLRRDAARLLRAILLDYGFFNVSTIDSFFQTVLRAFAREAELESDYQVELDDKGAFAESVTELLEDVRRVDGKQDEKLKEMLADYMSYMQDGGAKFNVFNRSSKEFGEIVDFFAGTADETFKAHEQALLEYLKELKNLQAFTRQLRQMPADLLHTAQEAIRDFKVKIGGLYECLERFFKPFIEKWEAYTPATMSVIEGNTFPKVEADPVQAFAKGKLKTNKLSYSDADLQAVADVCRAIREANDALCLRNMFLHNLYLLGLIARIVEHLKSRAGENATLRLSETNTLLRSVIGDDDAPFVYERVGLWLNHFLIDEFQDTSRMQWDNLKPLVRESLALDNDNLVIGDEKQCIYRFRNSDPELLAGMDSDPELRRSVNLEGDTEEGNTNWRSARHIVEFNNAFFTYLAGVLGLSDTYRNVVQQVAPRNAGLDGYVKVIPIGEGSGDTGGDDDDEDVTPDYSLDPAVHCAIAEIAGMLQRGYRPGDICCLFRNAPEAQAFINAFLAAAQVPGTPLEGINVISDDSLAVDRASSVQLTLNILRIADRFSPLSPAEDAAEGLRQYAALMHTYYAAQGEDIPADVAFNRAVRHVHDMPPEAFDELFSKLFPADSPLTLTALVHSVINDHVPEATRHAQHTYLAAFEDLVADYCDRNSNSLRDFLQWWDAAGFKARVSSPDDATSLRVMTIHKSKGLEFPCVVMPKLVPFKRKDVVWTLLHGFDDYPPAIVPPVLPLAIPSDKQGRRMLDTPYAAVAQKWLYEQDSDDTNVLYVAMTRAVRELVICYEVKPSKPGYSTYMGQGLPGVADLLTEQPDGSLTYGAPTAPRAEKAKAATVLDTIDKLEVPLPANDDRRDLLASLAPDPETLTATRPFDAAAMLRGVLRRADTATAARALVEHNIEQHALEGADADTLRHRLEDVLDKHAALFADDADIAMRRRIYLPGAAFEADRIVTDADGHSTTVLFATPDTPLPDIGNYPLLIVKL